jgi:hypothetical protein
MELALNPVASFSPMQGNLLQSAAADMRRQASNGPAGGAAASVTREPLTRGDERRADPFAAGREVEREARAGRANETSKTAGFEFEYKDSTQVMKVNDSKGVLIYQVPSKGQLALLEATDPSAAQVKTTA